MRLVELPLCEDTIINSSVDYAHVLSIALNNYSTYEWFAENFVQMIVGNDTLGVQPSFYNFTDYRVFYNTEYYLIANNRVCPTVDIYRDAYSIIKERNITICNYIKEKLDNNYYVLLFLDITEIAAYHLRIKYHCPLIYGYDETGGVFLFRDYCGKHYVKERMTFEELENGFMKFLANDIEYAPFISYGINSIKVNDNQYKLDISMLKSNLKDYLLGDNVRKEYQKFIQNSNYHYGISVLKLTKDALSYNLLNGNDDVGWRVRYAHFIDFEKAMLIRIKMLAEKKLICKEYDILLGKVNESLSLAERLMLLYLKYLRKKDKKIIATMIEILDKIEINQKDYMALLIEALVEKIDVNR